MHVLSHTVFGGVVVLILLVANLLTSFVTGVGSTPAKEVESTVQFYEAAASSWPAFAFLLLVSLWLFGGFAHALALVSTRHPARRMAVIPIFGILGMFCILLFAYGRLPGGEGFSREAGDPVDWLMRASLLIPLLAQIADILLPPWPSWAVRGKDKAIQVA